MGVGSSLNHVLRPSGPQSCTKSRRGLPSGHTLGVRLPQIARQGSGSRDTRVAGEALGKIGEQSARDTRAAAAGHGDSRDLERRRGALRTKARIVGQPRGDDVERLAGALEHHQAIDIVFGEPSHVAGVAPGGHAAAEPAVILGRIAACPQPPIQKVPGVRVRPGAHLSVGFPHLLLALAQLLPALEIRGALGRDGRFQLQFMAPLVQGTAQDAEYRKGAEHVQGDAHRQPKRPPPQPRDEQRVAADDGENEGVKGTQAQHHAHPGYRVRSLEQVAFQPEDGCRGGEEECRQHGDDDGDGGAQGAIREIHSGINEGYDQELTEGALLVEGIQHLDVERRRLVETADGVIEQNVRVLEKPGRQDNGQRDAQEAGIGGHREEQCEHDHHCGGSAADGAD